MAISYIDETGFNLAKYENIKADKEISYKEKFGQDFDVSDESVSGMLIAIDAKVETDLNELAQEIWSNFDPNQAQGLNLDFLCSLSGITRLKALPTIVSCSVRGDEGTILDSGRLVSQQGGEIFFENKTQKTISKNNAVEIYFSINSVQNNTAYTITINETNIFTYTSDVDATENEILTGLKNAIDSGGLQISTEIMSSQLHCISYNGLIENKYEATTANITIDLIGSYVQFSSIQTGPFSIPAQTLIEIQTPVSGWDSVINYLQGEQGRNVETDDELRIRRESSLQIAKCTTENGIASAIKQNVENVSDAFIISNRTNITDVEGRPPKSFETIVVGGDDNEIAQELWESQPAGIESYGNITVLVADSQGVNQTIKFSRPVAKYIWLDITIDTDTTFPTGGIEFIKNKILSFALTEFTIGKDILRLKLLEPIFDIQGVIDVMALKIAYTSSPAPPLPEDYVELNISILATEYSVFSNSQILITVL